MPAGFSETVALVAGGTGALGRAVSLAFLSEGASVVATSRRRASRRAPLGRGRGRERLSGEAVDVTDEAAVGKLVAAIRARHGRLDALVNCVGGYAGGSKLWKRMQRPSTTCWR